MISKLDVSVLDINSQERGISTSDLMENAGKALAGEIMEIGAASEVLFMTGTGNNGGDGMVAARILSETGMKVTVMLIRPCERIGSKLARNAYDELPDNVVITEWDGATIPDVDIIVDGLLGSGASGEPRGPYADAVVAMNSLNCIKIAIDIPTGIGTGTCFKADRTVTFHDIKSNMPGKEECGRIVVKDIGIPQKAVRYVGKGDLLRIPKKRSDSHKGQTGKVLIIGGGPYTGAPLLASLAAVRMGSDLVKVAVPRGIWEVLASSSPDIIVERLNTDDPFAIGPEIIEAIKGPLKWADSILIGPGAGSSEATLETLADIISMSIDIGKRLVIDADGITAASSIFKDIREVKDVLFTPHRKELERLLDGMGLGYDQSRLERPFEGSRDRDTWSIEALDPVIRFTKRTGCDLLVKSDRDMVITAHPHSLDRWISHKPAFIRYIDRGVPEMSVGGTGDILAGMCAGLLAKGMSSFDSACVAAYINGSSGELARKEMGISMSASSIIEIIPQVLSGS